MTAADAASAPPILLTAIAALAGVYAFVCHVREERAARAAVRRVRERQPAAWQSLGWAYRRLTSPSITIRVLRGRHGALDPAFEQQLGVVTRLTRQKLTALGVGLVSIAFLVIGIRFPGWTWH
jgi:hypothetical protein